VQEAVHRHGLLPDICIDDLSPLPEDSASSVTPLTIAAEMAPYLRRHEVVPKEVQMLTVLENFARARAAAKRINEWRRQIQTRNGMEDARRAQAKRMLVQQNYTNPMLAGYSCSDALPKGKHRHSL
jgi:hypothetical protein